MMAKIMKLVSLLETLLETIENNEMILTSETLENFITCLRVMQTRIHLLQYQSQLLNDEIGDLKSQNLVKCFELVLFRPILSMVMMMVIQINSALQINSTRQLNM